MFSLFYPFNSNICIFDDRKAMLALYDHEGEMSMVSSRWCNSIYTHMS